MLYYLFEWLHKLNFPGAGMFGYTSFRALMAVILALLISSIWGDKFINLLKRKQITETQRDAKTDPFGVNKVGVPSMGGVIIIVAILIPCLLLGKLHNIYMILMLITTVWLGSLGFADDYIKIFKKDKEGLHGKFKIIGQVGLGLIVGMTLYLSPDVVIRENIEVHNPGQEMEVIHGTNDLKSTQTTIPFFKSNNLDYADLVSFMGEHAQTAGWILFVIITIFVVTAVSNGANLNDGMDGMAAGPSLMFVALPKTFYAMGKAGYVIGLVFFLLTAFAALTSCISVLEAITANCMEIFHTERKKTTSVLTVIYLIATAVIALGYSVFYVEVNLPNGSTGQLLDIMDYISNSFLMPLISVFSTILVGWIVGPKWIAEEMEHPNGKFSRKRLYNVMIKFVAPVIMVILFLQSTGLLDRVLGMLG